MKFDCQNGKHKSQVCMGQSQLLYKKIGKKDVKKRRKNKKAAKIKKDAKIKKTRIKKKMQKRKTPYKGKQEMINPLKRWTKCLTQDHEAAIHNGSLKLIS